MSDDETKRDLDALKRFLESLEAPPGPPPWADSELPKTESDFACKSCNMPTTIRQAALENVCLSCKKENPGWRILIQD